MREFNKEKVTEKEVSRAFEAFEVAMKRKKFMEEHEEQIKMFQSIIIEPFKYAHLFLDDMRALQGYEMPIVEVQKVYAEEIKFKVNVHSWLGNIGGDENVQAFINAISRTIGTAPTYFAYDESDKTFSVVWENEEKEWFQMFEVKSEHKFNRDVRFKYRISLTIGRAPCEMVEIEEVVPEQIVKKFVCKDSQEAMAAVQQASVSKQEEPSVHEEEPSVHEEEKSIADFLQETHSIEVKI